MDVWSIRGRALDGNQETIIIIGDFNSVLVPF